jgi:hypothetical protein
LHKNAKKEGANTVPLLSGAKLSKTNVVLLFSTVLVVPSFQATFPMSLRQVLPLWRKIIREMLSVDKIAVLAVLDT